MKTLSLSHEKIGLVDVIVLNGILNADTSLRLDELLQPLSESEKPFVLLDMENLSYISSAGIGCFIGVVKRIRNKAGDIRFCKIDPKVKRVFELLDMADFFKFFSSLDEALTSFEEIR